MSTFKKISREPIPVELVEDEHEAENDFKPSFWFNNRRYFLENFIRTHNTPWLGAFEKFPEYIHAVEAESYFHPLYIELIGDVAVNVYEEE